jgi:hypothetical protein
MFARFLEAEISSKVQGGPIATRQKVGAKEVTDTLVRRLIRSLGYNSLDYSHHSILNAS